MGRGMWGLASSCRPPIGPPRRSTWRGFYAMPWGDSTWRAPLSHELSHEEACVAPLQKVHVERLAELSRRESESDVTGGGELTAEICEHDISYRILVLTLSIISKSQKILFYFWSPKRDDDLFWLSLFFAKLSTTDFSFYMCSSS